MNRTTRMAIVFVTLLANALDAGDRTKKSNNHGTAAATYQSGGLFRRQAGYSTSEGNATTYYGGRSSRPALTAESRGNEVVYHTRGLFGRSHEVGRATTEGDTTTYSQPGLFGRERDVLKVLQDGSRFVYTDMRGREVATGTVMPNGQVEYRGKNGRLWFTASGNSDPRRDGFVEMVRQQVVAGEAAAAASGAAAAR